MLAIGEIKTGYLLVTKDQNVYDQGPENMSSTSDQIDLMSEKFEPLSKKWPALSKVKAVSGSFTLSNKLGEYIFFLGQSSQETVIFDINLKLLLNDSLQYDYSQNPVCTSGSSYLYCFFRSYNDFGLKVNRFEVSKDGNTFHLAPQPGIPSKLVCLFNNSNGQTQVYMMSTKNCSTSKWPLKMGLLVNNRFHLMGSDHNVYIFAESIFDSNSSVPLTTVKFDKFFHCTGKLNVCLHFCAHVYCCYISFYRQ